MKSITLYINDKGYDHFLELAKKLHSVKKIETDSEPTKQEIVNNLKKDFRKWL